MSALPNFLNIFLFVTFMLTAGIEDAKAGAIITITYTDVKTEVSPFQKTFSTNENRTYSLKGSEVGFSGSGGFKTSSGMRLGKDLEGDTNNGTHFKVKYSVVNGSIVVFTDFPSYTTTRTISTNHKDSCTSTLVYRKKSGYQNFEVQWEGHPVLFSDMHAENITCSINETAN